MIETGIRLEKGIPGSPKVSMTGSLDFFESLEKRLGDNKKLPKWVGELYLEYHRGTLTSMARNKRYNRISEHLYQELEWLWSLAVKECQVEYPGEILKKGWEIICLNQFHDIIPGSSIKKVYEDSKVQYEEILEIGKNLKEQAMKAIADNLDIQEPSIVAFNALGFNRSQVGTIKVEDRLEDVYLEDIPSKGYKVFKIEDLLKAKASTKDESQEADLGVLVSQERMENNFIRLELNDQGYITRLYDKTNDREVFVDGAMGNVFQAFEDKPHNWDAWDINIYYQEKMWEVNGLISVEVLDTSEYKGSLRIKRRYQDSEISQIMTIYHDSPRVDFETEVDWHEKQVLLKTAFPVDVHSDKATYDIQFGNIERPTHGNTSWDAAKFEVCAHKWADLSEGDYGVSLLNNCKYGYDITDRQMRLTLIKSPTAPNEDADREVHYFTYSLYPHKGDLRHSETIKEGYALNQPLSLYEVVTKEGSHELGTIDKASMEFSLISTDQDNIVIETVKQAEYSNDIVFRVYETANSRTKARFSFGYDIVEVVSCDFEERVDYTCLDFDGSTFTDSFQPFEIKTYKVKFA